MSKFILKRIGISALVLFVASVLMYILVINSGDPLADLRESNDPNRDNIMAQRSERMGLHLPWYTRYLGWLKGVSGCFVGSCDFGLDRNGQSVNGLLTAAMGSTIRLVLLATLLGILVGIFFGVMTAIRQYSGFDYTITAIAFILYSLPSFVFAVLLKEYGAIRFNSWLSDASVSITSTILLALIFAAFCQAVVAGNLRNRLITGGSAFVAAVAIIQFLSVTRWFANPGSGPWIPALVGVTGAVLFTALLVNISNRRALVNVLAVAGAYLVVIIALDSVLMNPSILILFALVLVGLAFAILIPQFFGGYAKGSIRVAAIWVVLSMTVGVIIDYVSRYWVAYIDIVGNRPISTIGSETPNFRGINYFWLNFIDISTHLFLPTIALTLMSIAAYTRYTRSSMLETLGQDYVRTARSKGLPERLVITRHAFRNAMIPITTIVAFDFAGLIGGAVITEKVFGWKGMGNLFQVGLGHVDPNPVMAFFLVTGGIAVLMNMVADIAYAYIDPRIRR